jgi:phytanoyl-CoA hydroxylase
MGLDIEPRSPEFLPAQIEQIRSCYSQNGYVVVRHLVPADLCDATREAFIRDVRPYGGYIYRQATANPERNAFTQHGHVLNSILNIQDLRSDDFPRFRELGLNVITNHALHDTFRALLEEPGTVVQTMYFEGNSETWAHQDTYYLDSTTLGRMTGAWIALEDIQAGAGRFYVYPSSHLVDMENNGGDFDIAFNHARYKKLVLDVVKSHRLECQAPALAKGDVLFWSSRTIHGSLKTTEPQYSRASITVHAIPQSTGLLQYQCRERRLCLREINGVRVHCPKDQNRLTNRLMLHTETGFPKLFQAAKKIAIKYRTH